jgi:DNA helicase-2/ATP-dependent DNA helicase PcrA
MALRIETLWARAGFKPNDQQREAILHTDGPLFLTAGPGSGKTRVLLWRTLNLIVYHAVPPEDIFLGTFTEKAALQLRQSLTAYLSDTTCLTGQPYDISRMPVGTVHSICRRILSERRFSMGRMRPGDVGLADELDQYFFLLDHWNDLLQAGGFQRDGNAAINEYLTGRRSTSRHGAVAATISLFNRFSEECLNHQQATRRTKDLLLRRLLRMYGAYRDLNLTDLSLLQQAALYHCRASAESHSVLRHVIVDEYQDTNYVQEALFFHLAAGHCNLCVVGDDDQALYRFRGSTVENLVEFEERCRDKLGRRPRTINLGTNYRSRRAIVDFYNEFIQRIDWRKGPGRKGAYRIEGKKIEAESKDDGPAVVASMPGHPDDVCAEVAGLVRRLLDEHKVTDPNQVAFLYPSLKSTQVQRMIAALEQEQFKVYAPRAGNFLDVPEAQDVFGIVLVLFGSPAAGPSSPGMQPFFEWIDRAHHRGKVVVRSDRTLAAFVKSRQEQIERSIADRHLLVAAVGEASLQRLLSDALVARIVGCKLSQRAKRYLRRGLPRLIESRRRAGRELKVDHIVNRITALDWGVLDIFYELMGFDRFRSAVDLAEGGGDEGPICNLALVSQYLARFQARHGAVLSARFLEEDKFVRTFFNSFLYALWRRGESEYEDAEDPFPKGRIPFLTVHQAKGLEFPVVVLGNPRKQESVQKVEEIVRPLLARSHGEPLDRIATFDVARMFYVALSRPQNLLIVCHYRGQGQHINEPFQTLLDDAFPRMEDLDLDKVPAVRPKQEKELPKAYSYTGDYLAYRTCPRRYMIYHRYNFAPARAQTMFFGSLVHRTVEDLHQWLRAQADAGRRIS